MTFESWRFHWAGYDRIGPQCKSGISSRLLESETRDSVAKSARSWRVSPIRIASTQPPSPREERGAFHRKHFNYHQAAVADHTQRVEAEAGWRHQAAADAHELLVDGRVDPQAEGTALRLSVMADHASYQARKARGG